MRGWRHGSLGCGQTRWRVCCWTRALYRWRCCAGCLACWEDGVHCTDLFVPVIGSAIDTDRENGWTKLPRECCCRSSAVSYGALRHLLCARTRPTTGQQVHSGRCEETRSCRGIAVRRRVCWSICVSCAEGRSGCLSLRW